MYAQTPDDPGCRNGSRNCYLPHLCMASETMRTLTHSLSIPLLVVIVTLFGCVSVHPLTNAAHRGDTQTVRTLLDQGDREGLDEALWNSACSGHMEVAQLLLERGANVNYVEPFTSYSCLQCAAGTGHDQMVSLLLQAGANREYRGRGGLTALEWAKNNGRASVVTILENTPATSAPSPSKSPAMTPSKTESSPPPPIY